MNFNFEVINEELEKIINLEVSRKLNEKIAFHLNYANAVKNGEKCNHGFKVFEPDYIICLYCGRKVKNQDL